MKEIRIQWPHKHNGFIDFIRGVMCIDQLFGTEYKVIPVIDPKHSLSRAFSWSNSNLYIEQDNDIVYGNFDEAFDIIFPRLTSDINYLSRCYTHPNIQDVTRYKWLLKSQAEYDIKSSEKVQQTINGDYHVIHVRVVPDTWMNDNIPEEHLDKYITAVKKAAENYSGTTVLLNAGCKQISNEFSKFIHPLTGTLHSGQNVMTDEDIVDFFTDLKLICGAKLLTCVGYNSGFSRIPCAVYNIPYSYIPVDCDE